MIVITIVRKPLDPLTPTVAANALKWGTGGLNTDASRVGDEAMSVGESDGTLLADKSPRVYGQHTGRRIVGVKVGRWPTNLIMHPSLVANMGDDGHAGKFFKTVGGEDPIQGGEP